MARRRKRNRKQTEAVNGIPLQAPAGHQHQKGAGQEAHSRDSLRWLAPAVAAVMILCGGIVHGLQTNRWSSSHSFEQAIEKMESVPPTIGDWESRQMQLDRRQLEVAGAEHSVYRVYRNRVTGEKVEVLLLVGPPGPISLHQPTACFPDAGWTLHRMLDPQAIQAQEQDYGEFNSAIFSRPETANSAPMRVCWGWSDGGNWKVPEQPRFAFAGSDHLFKLYILSDGRETTPATRMAAENATGTSTRFLRVFLPALKQAGI